MILQRVVRLALATSVAAAFAGGGARAQTPDAPPAPPAKPRVYALVAAIGDQFSVVVEGPRTGTHLSPYQRRTSVVPDDILNRLALSSLDQAIARADPRSKRVYMALPGLSMDNVAPNEREEAAIEAIRHALERMPERAGWDRIVIATPAYRALEATGLSGRLQGFGLFAESQCQAACGGLDPQSNIRSIQREPSDGVDAITSEDKPIKARTFLAPFSYIAVWILDPKTLAVVEREESLESQKLAQPLEKPLDLSQADGQKYIALRVTKLIDASVGDAVMHSEINARRGVVEVSPVKVVPEGEPKK